MEFLITEQQLKFILEQESNNKFTEALRTMNEFTNNMVNRVLTVYGMNLKMLATWGTSVGGFVMPLDNYIRNGGFNLNDDQINLILCGVIFVLFFENKRGLSKILNLIKKQNVESEFEKALDKGTQLKVAFQEFMEGIRTSSLVISEIVTYSFIIPIITDVFEMSRGTEDIKTISSRIMERLLAAGVTLISREVLNSFLKKLIKRFKKQ